jgi:hypothetical protein
LYPAISKEGLTFSNDVGFPFPVCRHDLFPAAALGAQSFRLMIEGLRSNELRMELLGYDIRKLKLIDASTGLRDRS